MEKCSTEIIFSNSHMTPALHWLPDGRLVYGLWDADDQQGPGLWVVPLQQSRKIGGLPKRVTRGKTWMGQVTVSHDGKVLTFLRETIPAECLRRGAFAGRQTSTYEQTADTR